MDDDNHATAGLVVAELSVAAVLAIVLLRLRNRTGMLVALLLLVPGVALLLAAEALHSLPLLLVATAVGGAAIGLSYYHGTYVINALAPQEQRAEVVSTYQICCFAGLSLPVIGIAVLSGTVVPLAADTAFGAFITLLVAVALVACVRSPPQG